MYCIFIVFANGWLVDAHQPIETNSASTGAARTALTHGKHAADEEKRESTLGGGTAMHKGAATTVSSCKRGHALLQCGFTLALLGVHSFAYSRQGPLATTEVRFAFDAAAFGSTAGQEGPIPRMGDRAYAIEGSRHRAGFPWRLPALASYAHRPAVCGQ